MKQSIGKIFKGALAGGMNNSMENEKQDNKEQKYRNRIAGGIRFRG